jgi:hypothetical protein
MTSVSRSIGPTLPMRCLLAKLARERRGIGNIRSVRPQAEEVRCRQVFPRTDRRLGRAWRLGGDQRIEELHHVTPAFRGDLPHGGKDHLLSDMDRHDDLRSVRVLNQKSVVSHALIIRFRRSRRNRGRNISVLDAGGSFGIVNCCPDPPDDLMVPP